VRRWGDEGGTWISGTDKGKNPKLNKKGRGKRAETSCLGLKCADKKQEVFCLGLGKMNGQIYISMNMRVNLQM